MDASHDTFQQSALEFLEHAILQEQLDAFHNARDRFQRMMNLGAEWNTKTMTLARWIVANMADFPRDLDGLKKMYNEGAYSELVDLIANCTNEFFGESMELAHQSASMCAGRVLQYFLDCAWEHSFRLLCSAGLRVRINSFCALATLVYREAEELIHALEAAITASLEVTDSILDRTREEEKCVYFLPQLWDDDEIPAKPTILSEEAQALEPNGVSQRIGSRVRRRLVF